MVANPTTALLPVTWGSNPGLTSAPVLAPNPTRTGLIFVNSGTVNIAICGATQYLGQITVSASGQYTVPSATAGVAAIGGAGSITMAPGDKFIIDNLGCTCAWNVIAAAASGGAITILEML
jgi:hypothetical protein